MSQSRVLVGTSSWTPKPWLGPFYPRGTRDEAKLGFYAARFPTVEIDASYYRVPARATVRTWRARTPEGFVMAAKFPDTVVGGGRNAIVRGLDLFASELARQHTHDFLDMIGELGPRCGPLLLQFPWFRPQVFRSAREFVERLEPFLAALPRTFRYAVEVRNKEWLGVELASALRRQSVALALADLPHMPLADELDFDVVTSDFAYVRLVGDRQAMQERFEVFDRTLVDQSARLERWARFLGGMRERVDTTFVYATDFFAGFAPDTARELGRRLGVEPPAVRATGELFPS